MRSLLDVVADLGMRRVKGVIHVGRPWTAGSPAIVYEPWSVVGPPLDLMPMVDADLAYEYLRAWSPWQQARATPEAAAAALIRFAGRPQAERRHDTGGRPSTRLSLGSGRSFVDPTEDLIYQCFTEVEWGSERLVVVERLEDGSGCTYVQAVREGDGSYLVDQRAGSTRRSTTVRLMPQAVALVSDWALLGRDIPSNRSRADNGSSP